MTRMAGIVMLTVLLSSSLGFGGGISSIGIGNEDHPCPSGMDRTIATLMRRSILVNLCAMDESIITAGSLFDMAFYREVPKAIATFLLHPTPKTTSASTYCTQVRGRLLNLIDDHETLYSVCVFHDNSALTIDTLYEGPDHPRHQSFAAYLQANLPEL